MLSRRTPDTRIVLVCVIALFLAVVAWRWSLRAGRLDANTAPTPAAAAAPSTPSSVTPTRP